MAHVFRKGGIPALAYLSLDDTPSLCSLVVKVKEADNQATITLKFKLPLDNFDTDQHISLIYDADNLVPGEITLSPARGKPSQLSEITRRGGNDFKSLRVVLKQPCTVLCPNIPGSIAPKDGCDAPFQRLMGLAKATEFSIAFDYAWLHPTKAAQFLSLTNSSIISILSGFSRDSNAPSLKETDWTVFSPGGPAPPEAPPAYELSLKRTLPPPTGSTSPPQTPPAKRPLLEPAVRITSLSPTEKATTTTATPSPRLPLSSPPAGPFDLQDAVETAVAKLLPGELQAALPDLLKQMLAVPTSSSPPTPNPMSPLHKLILNSLTNHAEELAEQVTIDTLEHATSLRNIADAELQELLDDIRLEFAVLKDDGLMEMCRLCDAKLQVLDERTTEMVESVEQETAGAYTEAQKELDELVREKKNTLAKALLRLDSELRRRQERPTKESDRRARSVPLEARW